jgi:hypothetical protein
MYNLPEQKSTRGMHQHSKGHDYVGVQIKVMMHLIIPSQR